MTNSTERKRNVILGALVADAAAVGLHWLYDQKRVHELANGQPEFVTTTEADYQSYPGYFAHAVKKPGDLSQYGEQALVMLQSLANNKGKYNKAHYEQTFRSVFGYGGRYVGYIDRPTRDTLDQIASAEQSALNKARALPFHGTEDDKQRIITKVIANMQKHSGSTLCDAIESAVRLTHNDDATVRYAHTLLEQLSEISGYNGANDVQLPAVSKLPPLVALLHGTADIDTTVESAVRVTNNNDLSVECGQLVAAMISRALDTGEVESALQAAIESDNKTIAPLVAAALKRFDEDSAEVVADIGMSCNLVFGLPGAAHILNTTSNYAGAVRSNILAGGDSCGRAITLGAIAGAAYGYGGENGIPDGWISQLSQLAEINQLLDSLHL